MQNETQTQRKWLVLGLALWFLIVLSVVSVRALTVTDVYPNDLNEITGLAITSGKAVLLEDYNETYRVPYPSHDGYAIVNKDGKYFDKVFTFDSNDLNNPTWELDFMIKNTTPYDWSDYHFEFWDKDFQNRYDKFPLVEYSSTVFQNDRFDGKVLEFWAPGWQQSNSTETFVLKIDLAKIDQDLGGQGYGSFGIRQVATTVPEPTSMLLVGSALAGLFLARKRIKQ